MKHNTFLCISPIFNFIMIKLNFKKFLVSLLFIPVVFSTFLFFYIDSTFNYLSLKPAMGFWVIDGFSLYFIIITTWTILFCGVFLFVDSSLSNRRFFIFLVLLVCLEILVLFTFLTFDILWFFIYFEASLLPIYILIICYGSKERRVFAGFLIVLYTLFGSIGVFYTISYLLSAFGSTSLCVLNGKLSYFEQLVLWWGFFIPLAIKVPMYPFHLWLPEAHVEAPTEVSVILAAILLKVGGYGFLRILWPLFPISCVVYAPLVITMAFLSLLWSSFTSFHLMDLKRIVAYSSIAHMNLSVIGVFSGEPTGISGSLFLMLSHGYTSAGLFVLIGMLYKRFGSRTLSYFGGIGRLMPKWGFTFYLLMLINAGLPGAMNFAGEFLVFISLENFSISVGFEVLISIVLSIFYSLRPAFLICSGTLKIKNNLIFEDLNRFEKNFVYCYFFILFFFGINTSYISTLISLAVDNQIF